jgi:hypothetical protein
VRQPTGTIVAVAAGLIAWGALRASARDKRLLAVGVEVTATVIAVGRLLGRLSAVFIPPQQGLRRVNTHQSMLQYG